MKRRTASKRNGKERKLNTRALAKSVRKPLPRPSRPFKDKRGKSRVGDWRDDAV